MHSLATSDALMAVARSMNSSLDLDRVLKLVMDTATEVMCVEAASLLLEDPATGEMFFHVAEGAKADVIRTIRMKSGQGVVGWVFQNNEPVIVPDVSKDERFAGSVDKKTGFVTHSILCVPMQGRRGTLGVIEVINPADGRQFGPDDLELCSAIASQAAIAIENAQLHRQILQSERMATVGQTVAGLAHCVKNILNGIAGGSYIVDKALQRNNRDGMIQGWEMVKRNTEFMKSLVLDLLRLSKPLPPEKVLYADVGELCESAAEMLAAQGETHGVTVCYDCDCDKSIEWELDPAGVRRGLLNLIGNGIDACSEEHGRVTVTALVDEETDELRLSVTDTGVGMDSEIRNKLFNAFFTTKGSKGTGLGLAMTSRLVADHGGRMDVSSELGKGSTFTMVIPRTDSSGK